MQFAGQRTDMNLKPIGEPYNYLIKLSEDVVPEPDAVLITGITPQATWRDGITEAEFFKIFYNDIVESGTIFVGFNTIRFDDEFMRYGLYRNFYDPYEWQWKDDNSRWDILDVVRMTRALRPEGIEWPFASDGKPSNRLELLTSLNKLGHESAHDALSDVHATIAVANMVKQKQPKLFDYLLSMRQKKQIEPYIQNAESFVYVSGQYNADYEKLTIACAIGPHPKKGGSFVFDLRHDPSKYADLSPEQLAEIWRWNPDASADRLPVKTLQYNRCPAVAPIGVLRDEDKKRLAVNLDEIKNNQATLKKYPKFYDNLKKASEILEKSHEQSSLVVSSQDVDSKLYDGFLPDNDKKLFSDIHSSSAEKLNNYLPKLSDLRLKTLLPLYKARNFPSALSDEERAIWEVHKNQKISVGLPKFIQRLEELYTGPGLSKKQAYILEDLKLYAESVVDLG